MKKLIISLLLTLCLYSETAAGEFIVLPDKTLLRKSEIIDVYIEEYNTGKKRDDKKYIMGNRIKIDFRNGSGFTCDLEYYDIIYRELVRVEQ